MRRFLVRIGLVGGAALLCAAAIGRTAPVSAAALPTRLAPAAAEEVTIPAGTVLSVVLDNSVGSDISRVEEPVHAHLTRAVAIAGRQVVEPGAIVNGVVTAAVRSGRVKGRARIGVRFETLQPRGTQERYTIKTAAIARLAPTTKRRDALEIGAPAAGGALIGALVGGKKGAAIGAAAGGGAGTAAVLSTRGDEIRLAKGAPLRVRLTAPLTLRVRG